MSVFVAEIDIVFRNFQNGDTYSVSSVLNGTVTFYGTLSRCFNESSIESWSEEMSTFEQSFRMHNVIYICHLYTIGLAGKLNNSS